MANHRSGPPASSGHTIALGLTDLMTSLAVIFVLLLVVFAHASRSPEVAQAAPSTPPADDVRAALERSAPRGLALQSDPRDPNVLRVLIPETLLNFDFGKSTLSPSAERFLTHFMPSLAHALCGPVHSRVAGVVIEGHTDDLGSDTLNIRLSQERSFRVLVRGLDVIRTAAPSVHACFSELASASGRGKQDLLYDNALQPDREMSRRVILKILLRPGLSSRQGGVAGTISRVRATPRS